MLKYIIWNINLITISYVMYLRKIDLLFKCIEYLYNQIKMKITVFVKQKVIHFFYVNKKRLVTDVRMLRSRLILVLKRHSKSTII